jgi:formate hydrogenlyase subunit 3/multisubunit Na+/H+ antiporter MnhD subunit
MSQLSVSALLPAALMVHALAIVGALATSRRARWCRWLTFGGSALASALTTAAAASVLASGQPFAGMLFAHDASGLVVDYVVTPLSAWFLVVLGAVGIPVAIYSIGYLAHALRPSRTAAVGVAFNVLIAAVSVVFIVNDVVGFLFAWEIMTLATAALVATEHETRSSRPSTRRGRLCAPRTCISSCRTSARAPWLRRSSRWPPRRDRCRFRPS